MSFMVRVAIALLIAVLVALALAMFIERSGKDCPDGEVSVLGADKWVCVKEGG